MGCCGGRADKTGGAGVFGSKNDKVVQQERKLGLTNVPIADFQKILKQAAGDRQVTVSQLGAALELYQYGQNLLSQKDNSAKSMLTHSIFRGRQGDLDSLHVFTIGLLYCKGTASQKIDALLKTYDTNDDGILFTTSMKKINTDLVTIAAVIMPALVHGVDLDEADSQGNEEVDNQVNQANALIFGSELQVDAERLKKAFMKEVSFLLNSVKLRSRFAVKIGSENAESERQ